MQPTKAKGDKVEASVPIGTDKQAAPAKGAPVKYKQKLTTLDVASQVAALKAKLLGKRLSNIYDLDKKTYLFKIGSGEEKEVLLIEVGTRFHTTLHEFDKKTIPSGLTMRMRRHLKSKRVEAIEQLGAERVIKLQFGSGEATYYMFLEFYAKGNMVLTDKDLMIICLTRSFEYTEDDKIAVGTRYPVEKAASLKLDDLKVSMEEIDKNNVKGKDGKLPRANDLYFSILKCCHMGMINPILSRVGIKPSDILPDGKKEDFLEALKYGYSIFERPTSGSGYLIRTKVTPSNKPQIAAPAVQTATETPEVVGQRLVKDATVGLNYFEVTPILFEDFSQNPELVVEEMPDFDQALRVYFENLPAIGEEEKQQDSFQNQTWKKYENIKQDQESRLKVIHEGIEDNYEKAQLIENNISEIQAIIDVGMCQTRSSTRSSRSG